MIDEAWLARYVRESKSMLEVTEIVSGDQFTVWCRESGVTEPEHHNHWVGAVARLRDMGLIEWYGKTTPTSGANHMDDVNVWRSMIYDGAKARQLSLI